MGKAPVHELLTLLVVRRTLTIVYLTKHNEK